MREAFSYMFKDNCLWQKTWIYITLLAIANILIGISKTGSHIIARPELLSTNPTSDTLLSIAVFLIYFITAGYFLSVTEAIIKQNNNILLPKFNTVNNFIKGLKYFFAILLVMLCCLFVMIILKLVFSSLCISILQLLIVGLISLYGCAFVWNFANNNSIFSFFEFKKVFKSVANAPLQYFKHIMLLGLIVIVGAILAIIAEFLISFIPSSPIAIILFSVISAFIDTYIALVSAYLIAKSIKADSVV